MKPDGLGVGQLTVAAQKGLLLASQEVVVSREITAQEALEILSRALAPKYDVTRTPDNEVYVKGPHLIRAIVKISALPNNHTCLKVRGDWGLLGALPIRLYNGVFGSKRVARDIDHALN